MITFPSTVLLATDGSSHGVNARLAAADITARSGASLHLVHAWRRSTGLLLPPPERNQAAVSSMLAHERDLLASAGVPVVATHSREGGWPAERILLVAQRRGRPARDRSSPSRLHPPRDQPLHVAGAAAAPHHPPAGRPERSRLRSSRGRRSARGRVWRRDPRARLRDGRESGDKSNDCRDGATIQRGVSLGGSRPSRGAISAPFTFRF